MTDDVRYFHGGVPGLEVGDMILPPDQTGAPSASEYGAAGVHRRDRVYLGTTIAVAMIFAAMWPAGIGDIYRVEPEPPIELDPDYMGGDGQSVQAPAATILKVVRGAGVRLDDGATLDDLRERLLAQALSQPIRRGHVPGRNDPCHCGSGRKFKRCHG